MTESQLKELRIGSIVKECLPTGDLIVILDKEKLILALNEPDRYEPLEITPSNLKALGFQGELPFFQTNGMNVALFANQVIITIIDEADDSIELTSFLRWIHNIQDIYFNCFGEELTFKK